jgi:hypothetical protein
VPPARLFRWIRGPQRTDYYGLADRTKRVPTSELAVAEAALTGGGAIAGRLIRQLREAPDVYRLRAEDGTYELRVSTKLAPVRDVPRSGWRTAWIPVTTTQTSRRIEMQVVVDSSGAVELRGRTADRARWPKDWGVRSEDLEAIRSRAPWFDFPTPRELRQARAEGAARLSTWLGQPELLIGRVGQLQIDAPATSDEIAAFETREAFHLPDAYRALVELSNGVEIGRVVVLGTRDAYRLEIPGPDRLIIAPPNEQGALALAATGEVVWVAIEDETADGRTAAPDLRTWVRQQLTRRTRIA